MSTPKREAGDKTKGFTLQKQRAIVLFLDEIKNNQNANVNVAIEYKGDVFLQNEEMGYVEEQKNYEASTTFSFNSPQVLNTLVYFLNIWLHKDKSRNLMFGFYTTNKIAKENNTERTTRLGIALPKHSLLKLLVEKKFNEGGILDVIRKYLCDEYQIQYSQNIITELEDDSLTSFLSSVRWFFEQMNEIDYEAEILKRINESEFAINLSNPHESMFVYASMMLMLEKKQNEKDYVLKFLDKASVENIFLKVSSRKDIDKDAYRYLSFDYAELKEKIKSWLEIFLKSKYNSNVTNKSIPTFIDRKVARHSQEVKIKRKNLEQSDPIKASQLDVVVGELGDLINDIRPTFLFGEIGTGKSTLLANHFLNEVETGQLPVFIPSTFLKGRVPTNLKSLKELINHFVNEELNLNDKFFNLDIYVATKRELTLIFDGLDEFDRLESKRLVGQLLHLSNWSVHLRIIASGRPIELQEIVNFNDWNCLTTLDLSENEIRQILENEAIAAGLNTNEAREDSFQRLNILKQKKDLLTNATSPLILCLIRDYLDENLISKTLGEILYEVIKSRLGWHSADQKESLQEFISAYPHSLQREDIIAAVAHQISLSQNGKISGDVLFTIVNDITRENIENRNIVVDQAISFLKSNFLLKVGRDYAFQSHQLLQLCSGIHIFNQVKGEKELRFKDHINNWREISFAAAVSRVKDEQSKIESFLLSILDELLTIPENTAAVSVILFEYKSVKIDTHFLDKVKSLGFRPLRYWGHSDSLVPLAYAHIIKRVEKEGFAWFFESYLNPKHPSHSGHNERAVYVLCNYIVLSNFKLTNSERISLGSLIDPHIESRSFSCHDTLPVIATVLPEKFNIRDRCVLLSEALKKSILNSRATNLLKEELASGNKKEVFNGLETVCRSRNYNYRSALKLWLLLSDQSIPRTLLNHAIELISKDDEEIKELVIEKIGWNELRSYLRFSCLSKKDISSYAAIALFKLDNERDINFIGWPIIFKSSRFSESILVVDEILKELIEHNKSGAEFIINHIPDPHNDELGISEIYIKYFLKALGESDEIHLNEFLHVIRNLGKFTLERYPDVREGFIILLRRDEYYNTLKKALKHLDSHFRYNAATVLLTSYPEKEKEALEIIIRSSYKKLSGNNEWLLFCLKLNFSRDMLDHAFSLIDDLPEVSRIFVIKLLFHNNGYRLNDELIDELLEGVLGVAYFLDWSGNLFEQGDEKLATQDRFFNSMLVLLSSNNYEIRERAGMYLITNHESKLNVKDKARCWLLYVQYSEFSLIDFYKKHQELFENQEFIEELQRYESDLSSVSDQSFLLTKYYKAFIENRNWNEFFISLLNYREHLDHHRLEIFYPLLIDISKSSVDTKKEMGIALRALMSYPTFTEDKQHNFVVPYFALLAHEFDQISDSEIEQVLTDYTIAQDEIACSLIFRLGKTPEGYRPRRPMIDHISLFATNPIKQDPLVEENKLNTVLIDGDIIPSNLEDLIEMVLLQGIFSTQELIDLSKNSNLSSYFAIVVSFSRDGRTHLRNFIDASEIGSSKYLARMRTRHHKSILQRVKELVLSEDSEKHIYVESIVSEIKSNKPKDIVDLFEELFYIEAEFDSDLLIKLFEALLEVPYRLDLLLIYQINDYIINKTTQEERVVLNKPLKTILKSCISSGFERHENEIELIAWELSLILLYIEGKSDEDTERGFLIGLKNVFIQEHGQDYVADHGGKLKFSGRDLIIHSDVIFSRIDSQVIKYIIHKGIDSDVPEISAVCRLISSIGY